VKTALHPVPRRAVGWTLPLIYDTKASGSFNAANRALPTREKKTTLAKRQRQQRGGREEAAI